LPGNSEDIGPEIIRELLIICHSKKQFRIGEEIRFDFDIFKKRILCQKNKKMEALFKKIEKSHPEVRSKKYLISGEHLADILFISPKIIRPPHQTFPPKGIFRNKYLQK
jgi:hypothetical protein